MVLTPEERHQIVDEMIHLKKDMYDPSKSYSPVELRTMQQRVKTLEKEYADRLPRYSISRCPYCEQTFEIGADFDGLDGPFWPEFGIEIIGNACRHVVTYLGALNYHGEVPSAEETGPFNEIHPGPEIPFVVPRLLELPGVKCVLSSFSIIEGRFTVYFMTYFADPPLPLREGHQSWLRQHFYYTEESGSRFRMIRNDPWDFNLQRWLRGDTPRLGWIPPGDHTLTVYWSEIDFPYGDIQGRDVPVVLRRGAIRELQAPDGTDVDLFD